MSLLEEFRLIERSHPHYRRIPGSIYLAGGDPNFATPSHIRDAAIKAIIEGYTHYPPTEGIPELREAIVEYYSQFGVKYKPSQAYITPGGGGALHLANIALVDKGDEILTFDPSFSRYFTTPYYMDQKVVPVPLTEPGYHLNPEELKKRVTNKSKMLIICNPNNPTGTVYTKEEYKAIADIIIDNDMIALTDEFYCEFIYDGRKHIALSSIDGMKERTAVLIGGTKCFAFTGWRLASLIVPEELYPKVANTARHLGARPSTFIQRAGAVAFKSALKPHGKGVLKEWRDEYDRRRKYFCKRMDEIDGISCHTFEGAFYAYPDVSSFGVPIDKFVEDLLNKGKVQVGNGENHGGVRLIGKESPAYGHIRPALVQDVEVLEEAGDRIERFVKTL